MPARKSEFILPTAREDAKINKGIAADPDTYVMSDEAFERAAQNAEKRKRGRPVGSVADVSKKHVGLRLDPDLVEAMRSTGPGWQTRANDALRKAFMRRGAARGASVRSSS